MVGGFELNAVLRIGLGKGDARRSRRIGQVPAIVYGGGADPVGLLLEHHKVSKFLENEAVYAHILMINHDDKVEKVILKAIQRHPSRPIIMHMDFQRVSESDKLRVHVPLHFINQDACVGVKKGGVASHIMVEVEISCLPQYLPEYIEVDMLNVELGGGVHLSDLKLPPGVELPALHLGPSHDSLVASVHVARSGDA